MAQRPKESSEVTSVQAFPLSPVCCATTRSTAFCFGWTYTGTQAVPWTCLPSPESRWTWSSLYDHSQVPRAADQDPRTPRQGLMLTPIAPGFLGLNCSNLSFLSQEGNSMGSDRHVEPVRRTKSGTPSLCFTPVSAAVE